MSQNSQTQLEAENKAEAIDILITGGDFTSAADEFESFENWNSHLAKEYFSTLSLADQSKLQVALQKS